MLHRHPQGYATVPQAPVWFAFASHGINTHENLDPIISVTWLLCRITYGPWQMEVLMQVIQKILRAGNSNICSEFQFNPTMQSKTKQQKYKLCAT